jgi:hypothetical protein
VNWNSGFNAIRHGALFRSIATKLSFAAMAVVAEASSTIINSFFMFALLFRRCLPARGIYTHRRRAPSRALTCAAPRFAVGIAPS